jgi:hypothetical protein
MWMITRLTLLFLCDQVESYARFIEEFRAAEFQVLVARSLAHAKAILLTRSVNAIVLGQDCTRRERDLATQLKRIAPAVPIFLLTNQEQSRPVDVDSIWRLEMDDDVVTRGMAQFFRHLFHPCHESGRPTLALGGPHSLIVGVRASSSN